MQMRPFFDRSLPAIMLRGPLLVLSILESYELYIRVKLSRQVFFSYNNNNNNNCIRNRKEQWRIGRFNLEFTKVRENPFRFVFYSGQRNRRSNALRATITRPVLPNCALFPIQTTPTNFLSLFPRASNFL